ncbi:hypothetical protein H1D37_22730, partial [Escherichia coli K-12]|nr:hypothetical protein [Escherichia coli K-12]
TWLEYYAYCPDHAQMLYEDKKVKKGAIPKIYQDPELLDYVSKKILIEKYSPEAVLEEIKNKNLKFKVTLSKNTIYRCIEKGILKDVTEKDLPLKKNENQKKQECIKEEFGMINDCQLTDDQKT